MTKQHYLTLDSFRGLCACLVALSHFNATSLLSGVSILDRGEIYVDFFFVLSGFVIFANYSEKLRAGYSMGKFVILRFGRLYPLHFCVLMAFVGLDVLQMILPIGGLAVYKPFTAPGEGLGDIIANLFLVHSLHVSEHLAFNGPSWSISTEFYTYILFAFILAYAGKYYKAVIAFTGLASAIVLFTIYGELYAKLDFGFLRCVFGFACGALTYEFFHDKKSIVGSLLAYKYVSGAIEIIVLSAALVYIAFFSQDTLSMVAPLVFSLVIFIFAFEGGIVSKILKLKPLIFLGTLSYSIYMTHMFISGKFFSLAARILESRMGWHITTPNEGGFPVFGMNIVSGTLWEIFYLFIVIVCSFISYKLIEEPSRNWTRRFVKGDAGLGIIRFSKVGA